MNARPVNQMSDVELREARADALHRMSRLLNDCEKGGELSEESDSAYRKLDEEEKKISAELDKRGQEPVRRLHQPVSQTGPQDDIPRIGGIGLASLAKGMTDKRGFETYNDFVRAVAGLGEKRTALEGVGESGGFAVPEAWDGRFLHAVNDAGAVVKYCLSFAMPNNGVHLPMFNSFDRSSSGGEYAGVSADWIGEGETITEQTPKMVETQIIAKKLVVHTSASREVLADGLDLGRQIGQALIKATAGALDTAILTGSGTGRPLGLLNGDGTITVSRATSGQISYQDLTACLARVWPPLLSNVIFLCSPTAFLQLLRLKDDSSRLIWPIASGTIAGEIPLTLLGKRLVVTDKLPELGTKGDLIAADMSQYLLGIRLGTTLESTNAARWSEDLISFRCVMRCDGLPLWRKTIKPAQGTTELGWATILA